MIEVVLEAALQAAPSSRTLSQTARNVNEALGLDWSEAKWRGIWKQHPAQAFLVKKKLGLDFAQHIHGQTYHLSGDMRGATVNDAHAPYHDPAAIALAAQVLKWWKPKTLIHAGDNADFAGLSKFDPNPARQFRAQDEIDQWQTEVYWPLKSAVGTQCEVVVLPGNHDLRFLKLLWRHPELFSVRSLHLPVLLGATELDFTYVGYAVVIDGLLEVSHGTKVSSQSGYSARAELAKRGYSISTNTGHVHRAGRHEYQPPYGPLIVGQESPCLCRTDPDYMVHPNWVQGLTLWEVVDHVLWMQAVVFTPDYTCTVGNKRFAL